MIKGSIFDVDGTLLDSMFIWEKAVIDYLKQLNINADSSLAKDMEEMSLDEGSDYIKKLYHLNISAETIKSGVLGIVEDFYYNRALLKPGIAEFLKKMAKLKIPMIVATSSNKKHISAAFDRLDIRKLFLDIVTCEEIGSGKTKPDIYLRCAEILKAKPNEIIVFEDMLYAAETAVKAGFITVGVYDKTSEHNTEKMKKNCNLYVHDLSDSDSIIDYMLMN